MRQHFVSYLKLLKNQFYLQLLLVGRLLVWLPGEETVVQPELTKSGPVVTAGLLRHLRILFVRIDTS